MLDCYQGVSHLGKLSIPGKVGEFKKASGKPGIVGEFHISVRSRGNLNISIKLLFIYVYSSMIIRLRRSI